MNRFATLLLLLAALPVAALSSTTWFVDARNGSNGFSGRSSAVPKRTIQAAVNAAASGDCIVVAGGVYNENVRLSKPLTLFSHDPAVAVIDGRHAGHCLLITESAAGCVIDGLVFTHGAPTNDGNKYGGGIDCLADATIRHCVFKDNGNSSTTFAGGLHTCNRSRVSVENCLFVGNYAWASGGATLTEGDSFITFDRCTVYGNNSTDFIGNQGGIVVTHGSTGYVKNCILWGNSGMQLAAYGSWYGRDATVHVSYSCVQGGVAPNGIGHFYDDGGNISADPRFLDVARRNFWFRDNSPCWRKGHPDFFERDGQRLHMGFWAFRLRPPPPVAWTVEITLDPQGGDCSADVVERNVFDRIGCLPVPQCDGYDFLGWFDRADGGRRIFPEERVVGPCTLYAQWKECESPFFDVAGGHFGISSYVELDCRLAEGARDGRLWLNGELLASSEEEAFQWLWQPRKLGKNVFVYQTGRSCSTTAVEVVGLTFAPIPDPAPPMALDESIRITPEVRSISQGGAGKSILVTGGNWTAAASAPWIVLESASGTASDPVAYTVSASTNVGDRVGYVYVSGRIHTIVQKGRAGVVSAENLVVESEGGSASLSLDFDGRFAWDARPNADWITVRPTHGVGSGSLDCSIAPYNEVGTRAGSVTFGDRTVSVFQYGRRMKLSDVALERDYLPHVLPITVNALAVTEWSATPNASWISVVDADNGQGRRGGSLLTLAISENPSSRARTGTVSIGTETFTVTQAGRPASACALSVAPAETTAAASGANGHVAVTGTPDLPWTAESSAGWLVLLATSASGSGNGNVFYTVSPNTTLQPRTGTIVIRPADTNLPTLVHTVVQAAAASSLAASGHEFDAAGGTVAIDVSAPGSVAWSVSDVPSWITVLDGASRVGSGSVTLQASPNNGVAPRSATLVIAGDSFTVGQKGRDFAIDCDAFVFDFEGDTDSFTVSPDGDMAWEAVASDSWISFLWGSNAGSGQGEVVFAVAPYVGDGSLRTGTIEIGGRTVLVSQRAYDLSISPRSAQVSGNAGAGEIGVSAGIDDVWRAIRTEDWITLVSGTESGTGSGTVRFTFTENATGVTRSGKIVIDGEVYTLTQAARVLVPVSAQVRGHGRVDGAVSHPVGSRASLTAIPDSGYEFRYWITDAGESMQNPLPVTVEGATTVTAVFAPLTPEFVSAESSTNGVLLAWSDLAWAAEYRLYRAPSNSIPSAPLATLPADGTASFLDTTGDVDQPFWYWVQAVGADAETESAVPATGRKRKPVVFSPIFYAGLRGAAHANPASYQEGTEVSFTDPEAVEGYAFAGWNPAGISADLTGAVNVDATWTPNAYTIVYHANGGSGTMEPTACTYDQDALVATNGFIRADHLFQGWATAENGPVAYVEGDWVRNLSAAQNGVVSLYAVWEVDPASHAVAEPVIDPPDGTVFKTESCTVTITCETDGASIYYTTNGRTPSATARYLYTGPFTISGTATITAFAVRGETASDYVEATLTYVEPIPLTLKGVLDEAKLGAVTTGGEAAWLPVEDAAAKVGGSCAASGALADTGETERVSTLSAKVNGPGTFSFWWRVDCEPDPRGRFTYDHVKVIYDGVLAERKDGVADWTQVSTTFTTEGEHTIVWTYVSDGYPAEGGSYAGRAWVDGIVWTGAAAESGEAPAIVGDDGATVSGDETSGYVIQPSAGNTAVEVTIPDGLDPAKVTVEVGTAVATVKPNGATIKIVKGSHDITPYLDIPTAGANGVIAVGQASVKQSVADESLDVSKGASFAVTGAAPVLTTAPTKPGLTYTLLEGATLGTMGDGDTRQGDGRPWTPAITVKGGASGFYRIKVGK